MQSQFFQKLFRGFQAFIPLAFVVFIITTNVGFLTSAPRIHDALFDRHAVEYRTGIALGDLHLVNKQILRYLAAGQEPLYVEATVHGEDQPLFSNKEVAHMADVKTLFQLSSLFQLGSGIALLVAVLSALFWLKGAAFPVIAGWVRGGAITLIIFVVLIGLVSMFAFQPLFMLFHQIGFRNDLWLLDPTTDMLVRIYPLGFWRDATIIIGALSLIQACLLGMAAILGLKKFVGRHTTVRNQRQ